MLSTFQKGVLLSLVLFQDSLQVASHRAESAEDMLSRFSVLAGLRLRHDFGVSAPGDDFYSLGGIRATLNFTDYFSGRSRDSVHDHIENFVLHEKSAALRIAIKNILIAAARRSRRRKKKKYRQKMKGDSGMVVSQIEEAGASALGPSSA